MQNVTDNAGLEKKIFNFRPVACCAVLLVLGIAFAFARLFYHLSMWWLLLGIPFFGMPFFFTKKGAQRLKTCISIFALLIAFFIGFSAFSLQIHSYQNTKMYNYDACNVTGTVVKMTTYPDEFQVVLRRVYIDKNQAKGKLIAYLPMAFIENIREGDELLLTGVVTTKVDVFDEDGFRTYAIGDNLRYEMFVESAAVTGHAFSPFASIRQRIKTVSYSGMPFESASVTLAVLLGDTSKVSVGLLNNVRYGGIAHVFAVSGLHVGALFGFVLALMKTTRLCKLHRAWQVLILTSVLLFYGAVCGFSASIVRASIMCMCAYVARLIGIGKDNFERLGGAAILVLLISPISLFEAGFMLSFAACFGIFMLTRPLENMFTNAYEYIRVHVFKCEPLPKKKLQALHPLGISARISKACISYLSMSTAAQIATAPIGLALFGYVSGWSTLLNLIFVPIITAAFALILALVALASFLPVSLAPILLYVPNIFWSALLIAFQTMDFSSFALHVSSVPLLSLVCYYLAILFASDKLQLKPTSKRILCAVCAGIGVFIIFMASI